MPRVGRRRPGCGSLSLCSSLPWTSSPSSRLGSARKKHSLPFALRWDPLGLGGWTEACPIHCSAKLTYLFFEEGACCMHTPSSPRTMLKAATCARAPTQKIDTDERTYIMLAIHHSAGVRGSEGPRRE